jgi:hypothetical protein
VGGADRSPVAGILDAGGIDAFAARKFWTLAPPISPLSREFRTLAGPFCPLQGNSGRRHLRSVRRREILEVGAADLFPVFGTLDAGEGFGSSLPGDPYPDYFACSSQGP